MLFVVFTGFLDAQNRSLGWLRHKTPEEAGWSAEKLFNICQNANASSVFLVYDGKVVFTYGEYWRRFKIHSVRKSILSALYGIAVHEEKIDLNKTMKELHITDNTLLTEEEQRARIVDLLESRSGIYLPAASESNNQKKERPERGRYRAGEHYYYNNWDFNVLGTIYRQETGEDIFEAFVDQIARPIGMEDFRLMDGCYEYEDTSIHPAYHFKMSARDLARFGQLFLQTGRWNGKQIIDGPWVVESTSPRSRTNEVNVVTSDNLQYGYLWWTIENYRGTRLYYAAGSFGQRVIISPSLKIVLVVQSNSYIPESVTDVDFVVHDILFEARVSAPKKSPAFVALENPAKNRSPNFRLKDQKKYCGVYPVEEKSISIQQVDHNLVFSGYHYAYRFQLSPITPVLFHAEDIDLDLFFDLDEKGFPLKVAIHKSPLVKKMHDFIIDLGMETASRHLPELAKQIQSREEMIYLAEELDKKGIDNVGILKLNAMYFPYSFHVQQMLNNALVTRYNLAYAAKIFEEIVRQLKKEGREKTKAEWLFEIINSQAHPQPIREEEFNECVGDYGNRHIARDGDALYYFVNPGQNIRLYKISLNEFSFKDQFHRRIKFEKDGRGRIKKLIIYYYRDSFEESEKN